MARFEISNVVHKPDIRGTISLIGRAMITLGLILLLFVAYQLWGTNFFEARSQHKLRSQFAQKLDQVKRNENTSTTSSTAPGTPTTQPGDDSPTVGQPDAQQLSELQQEEKEGQPIAVIKIKRIGLDHVVVSGTAKGDLQKGPGHYPATPLPGQFGNVAIAGHRTTYGAPFNRLDEVQEGDEIILETVRGTFTYKVNQPNKVVDPSDVSVINPTPDPTDPSGKTLLPTLTLTTCHPKYSAAKRLVIRAQLIPSDVKNATVAAQLQDKSGKIPNKINIGNNDDTQNVKGIGHSNILVAMGLASFHLPLLWWLLLLTAVGCGWWYLFKRFHNWRTWIIGALPFAVALLFYFIHLEHALPSNI